MNLKMFKILNGGSNFLRRGPTRNTIKRFFLSNAYKCTEAWENRLKNPVFNKLDFENMWHELDVNFRQSTRISVLDIDLMANGVSDSNFKAQFEDILWKLRLLPECSILPERSNHAFIRWFMDHAPKEDLLNVLGDRINFGLFPDYYLNNVLMDKFLKEKDAVSAVKIAVLQMLQEDFDHPIMRALALHCCYNYLASPDVWESVKEPELDPGEEPVKIRVPFIINPYFDDHFDITDTNHLVGKTLWLFGMNEGGSLGASSQLVGLVLYEKYEKCAGFLKDCIENKVPLHSDAVEKAKEFAMKRPKQEPQKMEEDPEKKEEKPEGEKESKTDEVVDEWKGKVLNLLEKLDKNSLLKDDLLSESSRLVKKAVESNEQKDIQLQCEVYKQWEKEREEDIKHELQAAQKKKIKEEILRVKEELKSEEEKLFFFEKEDELETIAAEQEEKIKSVVYYKGKGKHKETARDVYIPPEVSKKHT